VIHGESIDGMVATGVALALMVSEGLTGTSNGNGTRNAPRWPMDGEAHQFAAYVERIGKLATVAKRRTQKVARQDCSDLSSTEEDKGVELSHLLSSKTKASGFDNTYLVNLHHKSRLI
jgi:hypothetical protein